MNQVQLIGHLCRDMVLEEYDDFKVINTSIVVNSKYRDRNKNLVLSSMFIELKITGTQAESAIQYLHKGSKVGIVGALEFRQWDDEYGNARSKHAIFVKKIFFLDRREIDESEENSISNRHVRSL